MSQFPYDDINEILTELSPIKPFSLFELKTDIRETDSDVIATFEIPGLEKNEDVNIQIISNHSLTVSGTVNRSSASEEGRYHRQERYIGTFHRTVPLPSLVSDEGVKAHYKKGVLEIRMQKMNQLNHKRIAIEFH